MSAGSILRCTIWG